MKESNRTLEGLDWEYLAFAMQRFKDPAVAGARGPGGTLKVCWHMELLVLILVF